MRCSRRTLSATGTRCRTLAALAALAAAVAVVSGTVHVLGPPADRRRLQADDAAHGVRAGRGVEARVQTAAARSVSRPTSSQRLRAAGTAREAPARRESRRAALSLAHDEATALDASLHPGAAAAAPRRAGADPSLLWPRLDPVAVPPDALTARITGHDPVGGRSLRLWRRSDGGAQPLGRTTSAADGHFDFGERPIPNDDLALVVTASGGDPLSPTPHVLHRPTPPAPAVVVVDEVDAIHLALHPAVLAGELVVTDERGTVHARVPVRDATRTVRIERSMLPRGLQVLHRLPDGRTSRAVAVDAGPSRAD